MIEQDNGDEIGHDMSFTHIFRNSKTMDEYLRDAKKNEY